MAYALLCSQHQKAKRPCCSPNLCPGHSGEPHLDAPCGLSLLWLHHGAHGHLTQENLQSPFSPSFCYWSVRKAEPFAMWAIGMEVPRHSRNRCYFRTNSNSITQIKQSRLIPIHPNDSASDSGLVLFSQEGVQSFGFFLNLSASKMHQFSWTQDSIPGPEALQMSF